MSKFQEIVRFCAEVGNPFSTIEEADKALTIHNKRAHAARRHPDKLREFYKGYHKAVRMYFRKIRKYRAYQLYDYVFADVLNVIKAKGLYGKQVFDRCGLSDDNKKFVYFKDGVEIQYAPDYGYYEVKGLRECDFYVLRKAYMRNCNQEPTASNEEDWEEVDIL